MKYADPLAQAEIDRLTAEIDQLRKAPGPTLAALQSSAASIAILLVDAYDQIRRDSDEIARLRGQPPAAAQTRTRPTTRSEETQ